MFIKYLLWGNIVGTMAVYLEKDRMVFLFMELTTNQKDLRGTKKVHNSTRQELDGY